MFENVYKSAFNNELEKLSAYYHGHTLKSVAKKIKSGIKAGDYIARRTHVATSYASQYGKKGAILKLNIPKNVRKEYLETDPANAAALMFGAGLPKHMRRAYLVKKDIPSKWISKKTIRPSIAQMNENKKQVISSIDPDVIDSFKGLVNNM